MNNYIKLEPINFYCVKCNKPVLSIDLLCDFCREKEYGRYCQRCGKSYNSKEHGWHRPKRFDCYLDNYCYCPKCYTEIKDIKARISSLNLKLEEIKKEYIEDISDVYEEDGKYYTDSFGEEPIALDEFVARVENYKKNREEIIKIREFNIEVSNKYNQCSNEISSLYMDLGKEIKHGY